MKKQYSLSALLTLRHPNHLITFFPGCPRKEAWYAYPYTLASFSRFTYARSSLLASAVHGARAAGGALRALSLRDDHAWQRWHGWNRRQHAHDNGRAHGDDGARRDQSIGNAGAGLLLEASRFG